MPYDRTHNFSTSFVAQLPFGHGKRFLKNNTFANAVAGGWQVNGLFVLYSGSPFTVTASDTLNLPGSNQRADQIRQEVNIFGDPQSWFDPLAYAPVSGRALWHLRLQFFARTRHPEPGLQHLPDLPDHGTVQRPVPRRGF